MADRTELVIRGGRVVDRDGERVADVLVRGGRVVEVGTGLSRRRDARRVGLHRRARVSSTSTCTCASRAWRRPRPSRPVRAPPRSAGSPRSSRCRTPSPRSTTPPSSPSVLAAGERAACDVVVVGLHHQGPRRRSARADGRAARPRRAHLHRRRRVRRRRRRDAPRARVLRALCRARSSRSTRRTPTLAGNGSMHEGAWSSRLGIPGRPAAAEDVIVARDLILAELTGARVHFLHVSTAGAVELVRAAKARGLAVTAEAAPHHFTLTDECCATFDPVFKVHPPLRTDGRRRRDQARASPTAPSTPSPPTTRRTRWRRRSGRSRRRRPGCSGSRPRSRSRSRELVEPGVLSLVDALGAALVAAGRDRRPRRPRPARSRPARSPTSASSTRDRRWEVDPLRLASKARNTPFAGRKLTGRVRHTVLRGEPVVVDGEAQR